MKKILIFILIGYIFIVTNGFSQNARTSFTYNVKEVIICDSQFVDTLISFLSNDSVLKTLQENFIPNLNFKHYFKGPNYIYIHIGKRNNMVENIFDPSLKVFSNLIDDTLRKALNQDSLLQVSINLSTYTSSDYKTKYKGWNLFFQKRYKLNNKPLFKITRRSENYTSNVYRMSDLWIPLIYYNNKLYIEPDLLQWFILTE